MTFPTAVWLFCLVVIFSDVRDNKIYFTLSLFGEILADLKRIQLTMASQLVSVEFSRIQVCLLISGGQARLSLLVTARGRRKELNE